LGRLSSRRTKIAPGFERQAFTSSRRREGSGQLSLNMPPFKAFDAMARLCAVAGDVDENVPRKSAAVSMTCLRPSRHVASRPRGCEAGRPKPQPPIGFQMMTFLVGSCPGAVTTLP
jgi:hypothetical protein